MKILVEGWLVILLSGMLYGQIILQPPGSTPGTVVTIQAGSGTTSMDDLLRIFCTSTATMPCFRFEEDGTFFFTGNTATYGAPGQANQSSLQLFGSTAMSSLAPPYLDLEDVTGVQKTFLFPSTTLGGNICLSSSTPGSDCLPTDMFEGSTNGGIVIPNASSPGTTFRKLAKLSGASALIASTTDTSGVQGIVISPSGVSPTNAFIATTGIALCTFDNATTAGHYVQISTLTSGDCHDAGSTRSSLTGQVIGQVLASGAAGDRNVLLNPDTIAPDATTLYSASSPAGRQLAAGGTSSIAVTDNGAGSTFTMDATNLCSKTSTTDQLATAGGTLAGTFATTCSIPASVLVAGSVIEVYAAGIFTTTTTANPLMNFDIKVGSNVQVPAAVSSLTLAVSSSNAPWILQGRINVVSGTTAISSGSFQEQGGSAGTTGGNRASSTNGSVSIVTSSAQTLVIDETATGVTGQTMNLQQLVVRIYK